MELNYKTFGQGDPLIILHGLFGSLDNWQTLGKKFAENHTVYLVDQRNHGRSPHTDQNDYPLMAADLEAFMLSHWIHKAHIMGHSMGGKTAMRFALDFPDMVDKLIVVDIAPKTYVGGHEKIFEAMVSLPLDKIESRQEAEAWLNGSIEELGIRQFLLKNLSRNKSGGYQWKMNLPVIQAHYQDLLDAGVKNDRFTGEALFIRGGKSNYISDEDLPLIHRYFPHAELKTISEAGHWVHADAPDTLYDLVTNFLK